MLVWWTSVGTEIVSSSRTHNPMESRGAPTGATSKSLTSVDNVVKSIVLKVL